MSSDTDRLHKLASDFFALRVKIEQRLLDHRKNPITADEATQLALALGGVAEIADKILAE